MALVSFTPVTDGSTASASGVNTPLSTIYNDYNGNITDVNVASAAAISFAKISGGSSTALGAWQSYTPIITNLTIGNGTLTARYTQIGKTVFAKGTFVMGSTSSIAGAITITFPVTALATGLSANGSIIGGGVAIDSGIFAYPLDSVYSSTTTMVLNARITVSGSNPVYNDINSNRQVSNTVPISFGSADSFTWTVTYEAA